MCDRYVLISVFFSRIDKDFAIQCPFESFILWWKQKERGRLTRLCFGGYSSAHPIVLIFVDGWDLRLIVDVLIRTRYWLLSFSGILEGIFGLTIAVPHSPRTLRPLTDASWETRVTFWVALDIWYANNILGAKENNSPKFYKVEEKDGREKSLEETPRQRIPTSIHNHYALLQRGQQMQQIQTRARW